MVREAKRRDRGRDCGDVEDGVRPAVGVEGGAGLAGLAAETDESVSVGDSDDNERSGGGW